jgi:hypothetical protein
LVGIVLSSMSLVKIWPFVDAERQRRDVEEQDVLTSPFSTPA